MTPLARLLLAACALATLLPPHSARAATIPDRPASGDLLKELPAIIPEYIKEPAEKAPSAELVDRPDSIEEIENGLRAKPTDAIPVEVVVEPLKIDEVTDDGEIKRPEADLKNPGPPQRQEHETQNPEHYTEELLRAQTIKENIEQTQNLLRQGFQGVTDDIQNWISNNEQIKTIQQNIQTLRETFTAQIQRLNDTIQALAKPEIAKPIESQAEQAQVKSDFRKIESRLKILEDNFNNGVRTLSEGIQIVATLRSEGDSAGAASEGAPAKPEPPKQPEQPATPSPPQNLLLQYLGVMQNSVANAMSNVTQAFNNLVNNRPQISNIWNPTSSALPPGAQADQPDGTTTRRPFQWPNLQLPQLPNFLPNLNLPGQSQNGQSGEQTNSPGSIFQNLSNLQIFQNPFNFLNPNRPGDTTAKPAEAASGSTQTKPDGNKEKPAEKPIANAPPSQPAVQPAPQPPPQPIPPPAEQPSIGGPIRQILSNSPVVQGIAGAVQRIQNSLTNPPERLRDTVEIAEEDSQEKGGFFLPPPRPDGHGDNIDVGVGLSEEKEVVKEEVKQPLSEETKKETEAKKETEEIKKETEEVKEPEDIKDVKPEVVPEKTE